MISICIPVYNHNVRALVNDLHRQAAIWPGGFEIWVMDDASPRHQFRKQNREIEKLEKVEYVELNDNVGRSKVRNMLAQKARGDHLLFLDCDVLLPGDDFMTRYRVAMEQDSEVFCGGHVYPVQPPGNDQFLHWYYGTYRETVAIETLPASQAFMSGNFLIPKEVFNRIRFNESIRGYGHEDTLFGLELARAGVNVWRIDNPVIHMGLDTNEAFLEKTRESVEGLLQIYRDFEGQTDFLENVRLLKTYLFLKKVRLCGLMRLLFKGFRSFLERNLTSTAPRLVFLDLYKLGYMCKVNKSNPES